MDAREVCGASASNFVTPAGPGRMELWAQTIVDSSSARLTITDVPALCDRFIRALPFVSVAGTGQTRPAMVAA